MVRESVAKGPTTTDAGSAGTTFAPSAMRRTPPVAQGLTGLTGLTGNVPQNDTTRAPPEFPQRRVSSEARGSVRHQQVNLLGRQGVITIGPGGVKKTLGSATGRDFPRCLRGRRVW